MGKIILKLATLNISVRFNIQWMGEEHYIKLNAAKENVTTETIEELDKLCQIMEDKKGDVMKIGEEWYMLMEQHKELQQSFNEERVKSEKDVETIQVLHKDMKLTKSARTAADN